MKPIDQTRFGLDGKNEAPGNCWAACLASILEIPLEVIPDEVEFWQPNRKPFDSWIPYQEKVHKWLFDRGLIIVEIKCKDVYYAGPKECFQPLCILSGPSPRNKSVNHATVACGNNIIHDPHPSRDGLVGDPNNWWYELFVKI